MSFESHIETARLTVLLDFRHPLAYLALSPTIELGRERGLAINWLPVDVPPLREPSAPTPDDDRGIRHRRMRAEAIAREIKVYAAAQDLTLEGYYRDVDPTAIDAGWIWVRAHARDRLEDYLTEVFRCYWTRAIAADDVTAVARVIETIGGDATPFQEWFPEEGRMSVSALRDEVQSRGLAGTPLYWVEEELFLGRQHLPMIRWILSGREGPGPI